jgi:hypothetical protein
MLRLLLSLFCVFELFAATPFSLDNIERLNVHFINDSDHVSNTTITKMKAALTTTLNQAGIQTKGFNPNTLMIKIESISQNKTDFIHISMFIGEEVITHRKDKIGTFAITYMMSDFIDTDEPDEDVYTSVTDFLISEFLEQYKEENE